MSKLLGFAFYSGHYNLESRNDLMEEVLVNSQNNPNKNIESNFPPQRKTTLKWGRDGELSAVDMARILDRLENPKLVECDLPLDEV